MNFLVLIPARGGSRGIPRKNLAPLAGAPLIVHTIRSALVAEVGPVVVSSDDEEILEISVRHGARSVHRPAKLATDETDAVGVMKHALDWYQRADQVPVHAVVYLQPTSPLRDANRIREAVALFVRHLPDTVVSVIRVPHQFTPEALMCLKDGNLVPYLQGKDLVLRRQDKGSYYARNGPAVLVVSARLILERDSLYGETVVPLEMEEWESVDIDNSEDLSLAEWLQRRYRNELPTS